MYVYGVHSNLGKYKMKCYHSLLLWHLKPSYRRLFPSVHPAHSQIQSSVGTVTPGCSLLLTLCSWAAVYDPIVEGHQGYISGYSCVTGQPIKESPVVTLGS